MRYLGRMAAHVATALAVLVCTQACHRRSPTSPSTVTGITIDVPGFVLIGASVPVTDSASFSDGTTTASGISLTVDNSAVATLTGAGELTGIHAGQVTVTATLEGHSTTKTVRIVPDYRGNWTGDLVLSDCRATGSLTCDEASIGGAVTLTVLQNATQTNDAVTGTVNLGDVTVSATGTIAVDGTLTMTGSQATADPHTTGSLANWRTSLTDAGLMAGTFDLVLSQTEPAGTVTLTFAISGLTRS